MGRGRGGCVQAFSHSHQEPGSQAAKPGGGVRGVGGGGVLLFQFKVEAGPSDTVFTTAALTRTSWVTMGYLVFLNPGFLIYKEF